ncbi:EAL domain-containing protein [Amphibacillus sp. Q70]|uniref:EAL domain-containing protein n=1 Tax=Amphibacillus sp. Q70 TaxID=3453416 RepID=UPI003F832A99
MLIDHFIEKRQFYHFFQPIYHLHSNQCIGFEALLRSIDFPNPELAFEAAKRAGRLYELDTASIEKAITTFQQANMGREDTLLFINVLPSTLINNCFPEFIHHLLNISQLNPDQIVLEISESEQMDRLLDSFHVVDQLVQHGFRFALDDVGKGYSNFDVMIAFPFDFIKLDRLFSAQLNQSIKKKALIQLFRDYCASQQISLILEGLETRQEYLLACQLGVQYAQGFFLGRPAAIEEFRSLL